MKAWYRAPAALSVRFTLIAVVLILCGCGGSGALSEPATGSLGYVPGTPNFDVQVVAALRNGASGADVHLGIPAASLVFSRQGAAYEAHYDLILRALDADGGLVTEQIESHVVSVADYDSTRRFHPYRHDVQLNLPPGSYDIQAVLLDASTGSQAVRTHSVRIPGPLDPHLGEPVMSLLGARGERVRALTSFLPERAESLRVAVRIHPPDLQASALSFALLEVERDTTLPTPPYWVTPGHNSMTYRGIGGVPPDTVLAHVMSAAGNDSGWVAVDLPRLPRGLYRLEVRMEHDGDDLERRQYFVATSPDFPRVETLDQMIEALGYIAYEREVAFIREAPTASERKKRFDAFWGSLVRQRSVAVNLLETYFARIEEANLLYSSYKEGWKTDRGMIYVLLGAPALVDSYADSEVWRYTHGDDALYTFVFDRVRIPAVGGVYENYILRRRPYYEHMWLQVLDRWRSGVVL